MVTAVPNPSISAESPDLLPPWWVASVPVLAVAALLGSAPQQRLLAILAAAAACVLAQCFLPLARFRTNRYFSPVNVALLLLHIKLLLVPAMLMVYGYENRILALTASQSSIESAILVDTVAYLAFCVGLQIYSGRAASPGRFSLLPALSKTPGNGFVLAFAALGLAGLFFAFGSVERFIEYFSDPAAIIDPQVGATWGEFIGTMLRPFFAFALVTWWAGVADRSRESGSRWRPLVAGLVAAAGITIANLTYGFNRGAVVFPLLSLVAVYSVRIRRIPPVLTFATAALCIPVLLAVGSFRSNSHLAQVAPSSSRQVEISMTEFTESVLAYCGGPQLSAVFYESLDWGRTLYGGETLVSSVMTPIPVLGKGFRDNSGPIVYNKAIYGISGIDDQIPAYCTELFGNFHITGVVAGFLALAMLLAMFESWLEAAGSTFGAFVVHYIAVWGAMLSVWSISVYVQILFYFLGPVYLYLAVTHFRAWLRRAPASEPHFYMGVINR